MVDISIEDFCKDYQGDPEEALRSLSGISSEKAATILIDSGGILSVKSLVDAGISRLEHLQESEGETSFRSYCIANGKSCRAAMTRRKGSSSIDNEIINDLFEARIEYGKVLSGKKVISKLASQSSTNIGNALIGTGRWIEALDFFQKAQTMFPKNGVAAFREMQCLMGFYNAARNDPGHFDTYSNITRLYQRIVELSKIVTKTYLEIGRLAGAQAVEQAKHAVSQIDSSYAVDESSIAEPFFEFIDDNSLALSLFCSGEQYRKEKFDTLSFEGISGDFQSSTVPEIFAMLNVMKADYALARQLFYMSQFNGCTTIFHETVRSSDTLDYSLYGVQVSAMCSAQRIAFDILDKISVSLSSHLAMKEPKAATFDGFWYKNKNKKTDGLNENILEEIKAGNLGLLALYDLHRDTTKSSQENAGFLRAIKEYRNSSTHRFVVLYDEDMGIQTAKSKLVSREHVTQFEEITLSSIRLARASLFYFCDAINFIESRIQIPENALILTDTVPDHDYMRGHNWNN